MPTFDIPHATSHDDARHVSIADFEDRVQSHTYAFRLHGKKARLLGKRIEVRANVVTKAYETDPWCIFFEDTGESVLCNVARPEKPQS